MNNFASINFSNLNPTGWGDVTTITQLLNEGADVNFRIDFGWQNPEEEGQGKRLGRKGTPLHRAVLANMFSDRKEKDTLGVVKLLLNSGADVNALDSMNSTPLHFAVRFCPADVVEILIKHGAEVNTCNKNGETPLHFAVGRSLANEAEEKESLSVIKLLLDSRAKTHFHDHRGKTPLHIAARKTGKPSILEALPKRIDSTNARDGDGQTLLHFAMEGGVLWGKITEEKALSVLKLLLDSNSDIDARNKDGRTPLHSAVSWGHCPSILETLIKHGADVNTRDKYGRTPLHNVASSVKKPISELAIFETLIKHGADVNARSKGGKTPLHSVASSINNPDSVIFETLIKHGADVNACDNFGRTPLHNVASTISNPNHVILEYESNYVWWETLGKLGKAPNPVIFGTLIKHGADVNARDNSGKTPLHLLITPSNYITGKHTVITGGTDEIGDFRMPEDLECLVEDGVKILIKHGADVNARDKVGEMPLRIAMREGLSNVEEMLVDAGGLHYGFSWLDKFRSNPREPIDENNWNINRIVKKMLGKFRENKGIDTYLAILIHQVALDIAVKDDDERLLELIVDLTGDCASGNQMRRMLGYEDEWGVDEVGLATDVIRYLSVDDAKKELVREVWINLSNWKSNYGGWI